MMSALISFNQMMYSRPGQRLFETDLLILRKICIFDSTRNIDVARYVFHKRCGLSGSSVTRLPP